jgi:peptide deformylase
MIYPIVLYGSPMLRKVSAEVDLNDPGLTKFIDDMFETMYVSDGVGLAAPQIGRSVRVFVIDGSELSKEDPSLLGFKKAFINPRIVEYNNEKVIHNEGCLSLPALREEVQRPDKIRIRYFDENGSYFDETYEGMKARIIQHEYDHLEGILFIDRLSPLRRKMLTGKLNNIARGKVDAAYKTKILK